ncbi:uncharacterized protein A4U43_C10F13450 [Asparagus officinalis]|uniref:Uncharacterized protein n=1 Tax=Asparagus officinalis TaxID=4686 RepID=A0A5P1E2Y9_ASPOF|nr:uncharacterized protein A4U43_C10F13450 [Asparagus officinalis]
MNSQFFSVIINVHRILRSSQFLGIGQVFSYLGLASSVLIDPVSISSVLSKLEPVKMLHERNMYRYVPVFVPIDEGEEATQYLIGNKDKFQAVGYDLETQGYQTSTYVGDKIYLIGGSEEYAGSVIGVKILDKLT